MSPQQPMENTVFGHHKKSGKLFVLQKSTRKTCSCVFFLPSCLQFFPLEIPLPRPTSPEPAASRDRTLKQPGDKISWKMALFLMSFLVGSFHLSHTMYGILLDIYLHYVWDWYIYLHLLSKYQPNVGKYTDIYGYIYHTWIGWYGYRHPTLVVSFSMLQIMAGCI